MDRRSLLLFPTRDEETAAGPEARASRTGRERFVVTQSTDTPPSTYYVPATVSGNGKAPENKKSKKFLPTGSLRVNEGGQTINNINIININKIYK